MKKALVFTLMIAALFACATAISCGGGDEGEEKEPVAAETKEAEEEDTPTVKKTEAPEKKTPAAEATNEEEEEGEGESLEGVPIYPGANKIASGEWSGSEMPIPMIGSPTNPEDYGNVHYAMYEVDDPPNEVFDWYKDKMSGWKEEWTFSGGDSETGAAGFGVWTKDDGKTAAWVVVGEDQDVTSLVIMTGSQ